MEIIKEHIKSNQYKPVYLLFGSERYLVQLYKQKLCAGILDGDDGMNFNAFEGKSISLNDVMQIAETMPFFRERRLILLENTGMFKNANDFADYLPQMPPSTHLIFCETEVDKRNRLYKAVSSIGVVSEMNGLEERDLLMFIASKLNTGKKKITNETCHYLLDTVGPDMLTLTNETEKLISYVGERDVITQKDVDDVCVALISGRVFSLTEAIGNKNKKQALIHYNTMLTLRERPLSILFHIIRHFNLMLQVKELNACGKNNSFIASAVGLKPFLVGKYLTQARNFTTEVLTQTIEYGTNLEMQVKNGLLNETIAVEFLVVKLTSM